MKHFLLKSRSAIILAICVLVWICSAFLMWHRVWDRTLIIATSNFIAFLLIGFKNHLTPSEDELHRIRNSRRMKNKTHISDDEYIKQRNKMATWYLIVGSVWGIYTFVMLITQIRS